MSRRILATAFSTLVLCLAAPALAGAANPHPSGGTGQPNQNCQSLPSSPQGFNTSGFQHATTVYAGAGRSATTAGSGKAVSQYDVACFQVSRR